MIRGDLGRDPLYTKNLTTSLFTFVLGTVYLNLTTNPQFCQQGSPQALATAAVIGADFFVRLLANWDNRCNPVNRLNRATDLDLDRPRVKSAKKNRTV